MLAIFTKLNYVNCNLISKRATQRDASVLLKKIMASYVRMYVCVYIVNALKKVKSVKCENTSSCTQAATG